MPLSRRSGAGVVATAIAVLSISGCGSSGGERESGTVDEPAAGAPWHQELRALGASGSTEPPLYRSAIEATPNTTIIVDGVRQDPASDLLVVGELVSVEPGRSYSWPDGPQVAGGRPTERVHEFNDPGAAISTVHVTITVDQSVAARRGVELPGQIAFGLSLPNPADVDQIERDLTEAGGIAALLWNGDRDPNFDYDPGLFGVVEYGGLLGVIDANESVTFPASEVGRSDSGEPIPVPLDDLLEGAGVVRITTPVEPPSTDPEATVGSGPVEIDDTPVDTLVGS